MCVEGARFFQFVLLTFLWTLHAKQNNNMTSTFIFNQWKYKVISMQIEPTDE